MVAKWERLFLTLTLVVIIISPTYSMASIIDYNSLSTTRIPYGEPIIITGDKDDLLARNSIPVDIFEVRSISVTYTIAGQTPKTVNGTIIGPKWQISVEPLPENAQINFVMQLAGTLTSKGADLTIDNILKDSNFLSAFDNFKEVVGKPSAEQITAAKKFVDSLVPIITRNIPPNLKFKLDDAFAKSFALDISSDLPSLINLRQNIKDMVTNGVPGLKADMSPSETYKIGEKALIAAMAANAVASTNQFMGNYKKLNTILEKNIKAEVTFQTDLSTSSQSKDFEKYLGLDIGAFYVPKIDELRQFLTVNVYWGTVEEQPADDFLTWQRWSMMFGTSIGEISDNKDSKIDGNNAYVYGLGFRINRYFRISAGGLVYRNNEDNKLKNEFFIGPSIDLTAFKYIKDIVGKEVPK